MKRSWYQPKNSPFEKINYKETKHAIEKEAEHVSVLQRTIREALIPTILFPEERENRDYLQSFILPNAPSHPSFGKTRDAAISSRSTKSFQNSASLPDFFSDKQSSQTRNVQLVDSWNANGTQNSTPSQTAVPQKQLKIHQDKHGNVLASSSLSHNKQRRDQLDSHQKWGAIERFGPAQIVHEKLPFPSIPDESREEIEKVSRNKRSKYKERCKKKKKKTKKKNRKHSPLKEFFENHKGTTNSLSSPILEESTETELPKSKKRSKKRKSNKETKTLEKLHHSPEIATSLTTKLVLTKATFETIQDYEIYNAAASQESLSYFLEMIHHENTKHITWTIIFTDADLSTPLLPSSKKYCTEKGPPCKNWNCICERQVRAMQARAPVFGAMFVVPFEDLNKDNCSNGNPTSSLSNDDPMCFLLPLGPATTLENETESIPKDYNRMLNWPVLPFVCDVAISKRWETFRKILLQKNCKCVTFNAGVALMPFHFHRKQDHDTPLDLTISSIRDLRLMSWILRPHATEQELELENFQNQYACHRFTRNENTTNSKISQMLTSLINTKESLYFLHNLYPSINQFIINKDLKDALDYTEGPLQSVLSAMECEGIGFQRSYLTENEPAIENRVSQLQSKARQIANNPEFLLSSPQQVSSLLFDHLKIVVPSEFNSRSKLTDDSRHRSTSTEVLNFIKNNYPSDSPHHGIINILLEFRELNKFLTTYIRPLPRLSRPIVGLRSKRRRIHPMWQQTAVRTGRLSCRKPNLQQVPSDAVAKIMCRSAFIPSMPNMCFFSCDYSQNEVRILAHMSKDSALIEMFQDKDGADIYKQMSSAVSGKLIDDVTDSERSISKQVTLAILYGMGVTQVAKKLNVNRSNAQSFFNSFFNRFRGVKRWIEETKAFAKNNGYVCTISGRRRYLEDITSEDNGKRAQAERQAVNTIIQGSAADLMKIAMIKMGSRIMDWHKEGENRGTGIPPKLLLQIHDELLFEVTENEEDIDRLKNTVIRCCSTECERELNLDVPLKLKCSIGSDWGKMTVLENTGN